MDATVDAAPGGGVDAGADDGFDIARTGFVNLIEGGAEYTVYAEVHDKAEVPLPTTVASEGECTLYVRPEPALCDPACSEGVCTATNVCTPFPAHVSVGTIDVSGLTQAMAFEAGEYGYAPKPDPPVNLFEAGAEVRVHALGAGGFDVTLTAPETLESVTPQFVELKDSEDAHVTWPAKHSGRVQLALVGGWHGAPYAWMFVCEGEDDGEMVVPKGLIAKSPKLGGVGLFQHPSQLMRFARRTVDGPTGKVEVVVGSAVTLGFSHE